MFYFISTAMNCLTTRFVTKMGTKLFFVVRIKTKQKRNKERKQRFEELTDLNEQKNLSKNSPQGDLHRGDRKQE